MEWKEQVERLEAMVLFVIDNSVTSEHGASPCVPIIMSMVATILIVIIVIIVTFLLVMRLPRLAHLQRVPLHLERLHAK